MEMMIIIVSFGFMAVMIGKLAIWIKKEWR